MTKNRKRNSRAVFLKAYEQAVISGWSREKLASELGIEASSVYARWLSEKQKGVHLIPLESEAKKTKQKEIKRILNKICLKDDAVEDATVEEVIDSF